MTIRDAEGEGVQMRLCSLAEDRRDRDRIAIEAPTSRSSRPGRAGERA